jgi:hypothetical protein
VPVGVANPVVETEGAVGEAVERLLAYRRSEDCYTIPFAVVRELQIAAMNERLQERIDKIKLVRFRAEKGGIAAIGDFADVVPLLLPHTAYKSYPESYLVEEKWDKLTKWLGTVSTYPVDDTDLDGINGLDDWVARLDKAGHPVSCSSGTTGKVSMLVASGADLDWVSDDMVGACCWATAIKPARDRRLFGLGPAPSVPRIIAASKKYAETFLKPDVQRFAYPGPPITIGSIAKMVALRKAIAEGTAMPAEIAEFEKAGAERERALANAVGTTVDALLEARGEKLFVAGFWTGIHQIAAAVRERGYSGKDFHPENMLQVGGGLKRAQMPPNYREFVCETFNIAPERNFQFYGMQEMNTAMPRCNKGERYHVPPWVVCLPLNKEGDALLPMAGEVQCRAAFFDVSMDGRWGGVIAGDKIEVDFGPCECGAQSPSIRDNIMRYADIEGDDKIACAGTIDAYVRGL